MIRDPSDGSVKGINPAANEINTVAPKPRSEEITSGLPFGSTKPEHIEPVERSREWLRNYRLGTTTSTESSAVTTGDQRAEKDAT